MMLALAIASCILAVIPAALFLQNLGEYRPLPPRFAGGSVPLPALSILIPARDEEANIESAIRSVLPCKDLEIEVVVLNDGSADRTAEIVRRIAEADSRVRLIEGQPLPAGWCGKNHACQQLATAARYPLLLFMDADVRVTSADSLPRLAQQMQAGSRAFLSGIPREDTIGLMEKLIIPLIHFVLLGFLPMKRMRMRADPSMAAACGQIIAVRRADYFAAGGHAAISGKIHDAVALARAFRRQGLITDLFDATDTFSCRMYRTGADVWNGFAKNAHEGLGSAALIVPATVLLLGGQVLPLVLIFASYTPLQVGLALLGAACAFLPRLLGVLRFRQSLLGAALHPLAVILLVSIQWQAFLRSHWRKPTCWKGRVYRPTALV